MKINKACSVFLILMLLAAQIFFVSEPLMASALTLTAPLGFSADVFQGYVSLNWTDNSEAFSYTTVERSLDQGNYTPIATLYKGTTVYKDYSLTNGHVYTYRARTYSNGVYSPYTNEKEVIYVYPTGLNIARTLSHSVDLEWTFPTLPLFRPMPYETLIERRLSSDTSWTAIYT
ncbi:MAG: hypothetical protein N2376_14360, partial [Clostridia bacterium]|nr:hypothetical protein [Clostridia bacterium]